MKKEKKQKEEMTMEDAFIREVDEDLKNESLKKLWDKYGFLITVLVVAVLTVAVSYESLKAWYIRRAENWADAYSVALSLQSQGRYDESMETLDSIINNKFGAFVDLAKMQQVNVLLDSKKESEALAKLSDLVADGNFNSQLKDLAIIKLASYKQDTVSVSELEDLLKPILKDSKNAWYASAQEMLALAFLREGNKEKAIEVYNEILDNHDVADELKQRLKSVLSVL